MGELLEDAHFANMELDSFSKRQGIDDITHLGVAELPFIAPNVLSAIRMKDTTTLSCILRAAWGLVLQSYLETSEVRFGSFTTSDNSEKAFDESLDLSEALQIFQLSLLKTTSIRNIIEQARAVRPYSSSESGNREGENGDQNGRITAFSTSIFETSFYIGPETLRSDKHLEKFDMSLQIAMPAENMRLFLYYRRAKLTHWQATNAIHAFYEALQGILMNGSGNVSDIHTFGPHDQRFLKVGRPAPLDPIVDCLHSVISRHARIQADAPAVCSWEGEWSYGELDEMSTRVASQLCKHGVRSEVLVPLYFEKSAWAVVAMLAVLKAGGAFVALDPRQPVARLRASVKQLASPVLLTSAQQARHVSQLEFTGGTCIIVDQASTAILSNHDNFQCSRNTKCPAYIIFTSGSTGEPKGVVIDHEAICTSCDAQARAFSFNQGSRVLQFASFAFDAYIGEIFTTLYAGGCVCIPSDEERNDISAVAMTLRVNFAKLTPTLLNILKPADLSGVQTIVSVGENLTEHIRDKWAGSVTLMNGYGPAECTVDASAARITLHSPAECIGYALDSCRLWVVDAEDPTRLSPLGCAGELYIEGSTLARSYLNDQSKTQLAFSNNLPWIPVNSLGKRKRVYKTGDFVQYDADGSLKFLGRRDMQVKIHGQRIELGEIESQLRLQLPEYQTIVVELTRFASPAEVPLLAAFLCKGSDDFSFMEQHEHNSLPLPMTESLRMELAVVHSALLQALPRHVVPSHFVSLSHMPLNRSGKLDRKSLQQVTLLLNAKDAAISKCETISQESLKSDIEITLQALWADVLCLSPDIIGHSSNFFTLGGNSMSVIRLLGATRDRGINLKAADIYQYPALRDLAARTSPRMSITKIDVAKDRKEFTDFFRRSIPESPLFGSENIEDIYPLTDLQKILLFYNHLQQSSGFKRANLEFKEAVDLHQFEAACQLAILEHQVLRTVFVSNGSQLVQVVLRKCPIKFQRMSHEDWAKEIQSNDCITRLEDFGAPIFHVVILVTYSKPTCIVLQMSHLHYDGFSFPVLIKSIHELYEGNVCMNPPKYSDFIAQILSDQQPSELYWRTLLEGSRITEVKPQPRAEYSFAQYRLKFQQIPLISMNEYRITTPSIIKAAWSIVLSHLTNQTDLVFGEVIAGRNVSVSGIDRIVGPCFDVIPIRVRPDLKTCLDLLRNIEEQHISGIPHENLGMLKIMDQCTTWPKWSRFSTVVNYRTSIDATPHKLAFGESIAKISVTEKIANFADIVLDTSAVKDGIHMNFAYDPQVLSSPDAKKVLAYFCDTVDFLVKSPNALLCLWRTLDPEVKISPPSVSSAHKPDIPALALESPGVQLCKDLIARIWETLNLSPADAADLQRPFYETRNHFETALVLRDAYHNIGADVTLEDIMDYPTFNKHVSLVAKARAGGKYSGTLGTKLHAEAARALLQAPTCV